MSNSIGKEDVEKVLSINVKIYNLEMFEWTFKRVVRMKEFRRPEFSFERKIYQEFKESKKERKSKQMILNLFNYTYQNVNFW